METLHRNKVADMVAARSLLDVDVREIASLVTEDLRCNNTT